MPSTKEVGVTEQRKANKQETSTKFSLVIDCHSSLPIEKLRTLRSLSTEDGEIIKIDNISVHVLGELHKAYSS